MIMLWGDLKILFEPNEEHEVWKNQHEYNLIRWGLFDSCGVYILLMNHGIAIHMMTEKKYPLNQEMLSRMLSKRLEVDHENTMAYELLKFIKLQVNHKFRGGYLGINLHILVLLVLVCTASEGLNTAEGLGHNLFSVGQFCDGDLEVAFRLKTCYAQNLEGDDLVIGDRESSLYTIFILDMAASSPVSLMSKASSTMSWLWHHRLLHLNFGTINDLTKHELVYGLPKFKYRKDHLCFAYERGKSKKSSHPPKVVPSTHSKLELLHMNLCGPMRVASINGKKYILMIIDAYS
ncbi:integrase, catalytic region, zinc finger, CCHC-type containing protein [Tanacetum coccineum]